MSEPDRSWIPPYVAENRVLVQQLNAELLALGARVSNVEQSLSWAIRLALGAVISAVVALVLHGSVRL